MRRNNNLATKNYKSLVKQTFIYITRALSYGYSLNRIGRDLRHLVNEYPGLKKAEKYNIWRSAYLACRAAKRSDSWEKYISKRETYDGILKEIRRGFNNMNLRSKKEATRASLDGTENIFFLCSVHQKCRELHKDLQGKIYVDRFWRTKVSGNRYYAVLSYIKNRDIKTVQEMMKEPHWLTTAEYCKHYFIPLDTDTVLHSSVRKIAESYYKRVKKYTPEEYYELRGKVYGLMNKIHPCQELEKRAF